MPTIATMVPRAAFAWVTRRLKGEVRRPADRDQPHQRPRGRRGDARARRRGHGVDGAAVPRRRRVRRQGGGGTRRRDQHLHRVQPGVPRPHLRAPDRDAASSIRAACREDRARAACRRRSRKRVAVVGAGPAGLACAVDRRRARPRGDAVRGAARDRRPVQPREAHPRQGGVRGDAALLSRARLDALACRRGARPARRRADDLRGVRHDRARDRHRAAHAGDSRHRPSEGRELRRRRDRDAASPARASRSSARAASASTSPSCSRPSAACGSDDDPATCVPRRVGHRRGLSRRGGRREAAACAAASPRQVWLLQRKSTKVGEGLAKTTGWIRRTLLKKRGVTMLGGVEYVRIDDAGLHVVVDGEPRVLDVDTIVICAGQEPRRELVGALAAAGVAQHADRRRRRRGRARREARDRAGDAGRDGAVMLHFCHAPGAASRKRWRACAPLF